MRSDPWGMDSMELESPLCYWLLLPSEVLTALLTPLPPLALARLQCTCVALRTAARAIVRARLTALRPPTAEYCGVGAAAPPAQVLYGLEGCRGCLLALGGFDTGRLPEGTPDDDRHDDEGCVADVELLPFRRQADAPFPSITAMDVRRADLATVTLSGGWVYAIGGRCGATDHSSVARLDLGTGRWTDVESMAVPLSGCAAAPLGASRFLVAGGAYRDCWRATTLVQVYDARSDGDSWRIVSEMTQFRCFSAAVAVPSVNTVSATPAVLAVLGGVSRTGTQMGSNQEPNVYRPRLVELYDGSEDVWSSGPSLLAARYGCAAALLPRSRRVAALGGTDEEGQALGTRSAEAIDLRAPTGTLLAPLPIELRWGAAAVALPPPPSASCGDGSEIMCLGGCIARPINGAIGASGDESVAHCFVYDEVADRWREGELARLATARWSGSAAVCLPDGS